MLKAHVFPNYKNVIRIIWFCIVLTAGTCSWHENQHYYVIVNDLRKTGYDVDITVGWRRLLLFSQDVKTISIFILTNISDMMQIFENTLVTWCKYLRMIRWPWPRFKGHLSIFFFFFFHTRVWPLIFFGLLNIVPSLDPASTYIYIVLCK